MATDLKYDDEKVLLAQVAAGDRKAFTQLYSVYIGTAYNFVFLFTKSKDESEEILQDVFVRIWEKREKLTEVQSFKNYLFKAVKNKLLSQLRHEQIRHRVWSEIKRSKDAAQQVTNDEIDYKEYYKIVQRAIEKLPPKRKLIFRLNTENGLSHDKGKVVAITKSQYVTEANVAALLSGNNPLLPLKRDILHFDANKYLFQSPADSGKLVYHSQVSRYIPGITGINQVSLENGQYKLTIFNNPIYSLYCVAFQKPSYYTYNRVLVENIANPSGFFEPQTDDQYELDDWDKKNLFTYELVIPQSAREHQFDYMLQDLNRYFGMTYGFEGHLEKRKMKCLLLVKGPRYRNLSTKGGQSYSIYENGAKIYKNYSIDEMLTQLNGQQTKQELTLPIIDGTGIKGNIDLTISIENFKRGNNIPEFKKGFRKAGLDLIETIYEVDVIVLRKNANKVPK